MSGEELDKIFANIDFNKDGQIDYSEFLSVTINKEKALSQSNMVLAFHHFDTDGCGHITADHLVEVFKRQGKKLTLEEAVTMIKETSPDHPTELDEKGF